MFMRSLYVLLPIIDPRPMMDPIPMVNPIPVWTMVDPMTN